MIPVPKHNNVLLKLIQEESKHQGNILIPDMGGEKPNYCEVIATGKGTYTMTGVFVETTTVVGEKVIIPSFGGTKFMYEGEEYIIVKDTDILATI